MLIAENKGEQREKVLETTFVGDQELPVMCIRETQSRMAEVVKKKFKSGFSICQTGGSREQWVGHCFSFPVRIFRQTSSCFIKRFTYSVGLQPSRPLAVPPPHHVCPCVSSPTGGRSPTFAIRLGSYHRGKQWKWETKLRGLHSFKKINTSILTMLFIHSH